MYNFNRLESIAVDLVNTKSLVPKSSTLLDLQKELNRFFRDSKCKEVIFTKNDRAFFGMCVLPKLFDDNFEILIYDKLRRFDEYYLEIDSKLIDPILGITPKELVAMILHEVGHVVNNTMVQREVSQGLHYYLGKEGIKLDYKETTEAKDVLNIGILRAIRKLGSMFEYNKEEYLADEFVTKCGYGNELQSAYTKIIKNRDKVAPKASKFIVLMWSLSVYKNLNSRRKSIIDDLQDSSDIEASSLFRKVYNNTIMKLKDTRSMSVNESIAIDKVDRLLIESPFLKSIRYSGIDSIEDKLYEYKVRVNLIEDDVEAMSLLRDINIKINLLNSYILNKSVSNTEKEYFSKILERYIELREDMIKHGSYNRTEYGLFVKYPRTGGGSRL